MERHQRRVRRSMIPVEAATDIDSWLPASGVLTITQEGVPTDNGDGSETVTLRLTPPVENDRAWFVRLSVSAD